MDFLEKLYSNENFGLYLVIAIAVLVVLFFIVLFLGKKDEKKTKELQVAKEKEKQLVENNATGPIAIKPIGEEVVSQQPKEEPIALEPITEAKVDETPLASEAIPTFKEVTNEVPLEVKEEPQITNVNLTENINNTPEEVDDETKEFDFEALADAINKELESIKESKNVEVSNDIEVPVVNMPVIEPVKEEVKEVKPVISEKPFAFPTFETVEPDKIPEQVVNKEEIKPEIKPVIEEKPKMPNVFSSVYVNRNEEKKEEVKPVKPAPFELPKKIDLPKKAEEKKEEVKEVPSFLDQIETESYQIDK